MPAALAIRHPRSARVGTPTRRGVDTEDPLLFAPTGLLIDGRTVSARAGRTLDVRDPATGRVVARVADADAGDCAAALDAAVRAQTSWARMPPRERSRLLRRAADRVRDEAHALAMIVTSEMGKPLVESQAEVEFAAEYLEWFAGEAVRIEGRTTTELDGRTLHMVQRHPVGPCLVVTPWNFPLLVPARGIAPALAAGCTVVCRPSALTPLSTLALARVLTEAGLPPGVLNVVVSSRDDATDPLVLDGRLGKVTFTGSGAVGRHLLRLAAGGVVRTSVELGGCAPFVVFDDADLPAAVDGAVAAKLRNGGAACTAANRFYVQRGVSDEFIRGVAERVRAIRIGRGTRPGIGVGPMIGARHVARLAGLVDDAVARGARVVVRGGPVPGDGHFFAPVVLCDVPPDCRVMREEIFGPVMAIATFDTEDEALQLSNDCDSGLAAYVFTRDLDRGMRFASGIEAGMVAVNRSRVSCVNAPFTGVKTSGFGASGGVEGIEEYLVTRCVSLPVTAGDRTAPPAHTAAASAGTGGCAR